MKNWSWLRIQKEGQFFERKSCYDRSSGRPKRRDVRSVSNNLIESLSAMANADGGMVVLGMEDDGTPTGLDYPQDRLDVILKAPQRLAKPPLKAHSQWVTFQNIKVLVFEVDWSPEEHQLTDGRYLLRVGDKNLPFSAHDIAAMKEGKKRRIIEARLLPDASIDSLDKKLFDLLREKTGLKLSDEGLLDHYHLAESRNGRTVLSLAAMLLFSKDPLRWHASCYVDLVKWEGTERRFGAELNVVKRVRIEAPLMQLVEQTFETIKPHIRERQQLVDLFFEERFEYPAFAWQEAIINSIAHRDYALEGTPIEVWIFDNRLEIRSPGVLIEPVTIERLKHRERIHASRNPRLVRVLTDLGYMRELGEGVPRMFDVMEQEGLKPPEFRLEAGAIFTVVLYNTPVYSADIIRWLKRFEGQKLNPNQKRLLAYAHSHDDRFTSRAFQKLVGVDIYAASRDIVDLRRKGIAQPLKKGGRIYLVSFPRGKPAEVPQELKRCLAWVSKKGYLTNTSVRKILKVDRIRATRLLNEWISLGLLMKRGKGRWTRYEPV